MPTILLVDDDAGVLSSVGEILRRSGYDILEAPDGNTALAALQRNNSVDLVITDRRMPGMDGLTLARRIKEQAPGLPVVIMTGYSDLESYQCAAGLGVVRHIEKPAGLYEFLQAVSDGLVEGLSTGTTGTHASSNESGPGRAKLE